MVVVKLVSLVAMIIVGVMIVVAGVWLGWRSRDGGNGDDMVEVAVMVMVVLMVIIVNLEMMLIAMTMVAVMVIVVVVGWRSGHGKTVLTT